MSATKDTIRRMFDEVINKAGWSWSTTCSTPTSAARHPRARWRDPRARRPAVYTRG